MATAKDAKLTGKTLLPTDNKSRPRIIIVDDDKFYLKLFSDLVTEAGYECLTVESAVEA